MKKTAIVLIAFFTFFLISFLRLTSICSAGWFSKEKEVKDEYLEKLFMPNIPYEYVKVVEGSEERRFIVVKVKEKITKEISAQYKNFLLNKGVNIYEDFYVGYFSWQVTVSDYAITITRKVTEEPDTIEVSESKVKDPWTGKPIVAVSAEGKEFRIAIEKEFGKKWRRIKIIPEKDSPPEKEKKVNCQELPDWRREQCKRTEEKVAKQERIPIPRYPNSKRAVFKEFFYKPIYNTNKYEDVLGYRTAYVVKASLKDVAQYYCAELKKKYKVEECLSRAEQLENPSHYRYPIKLFGIKTLGVYVILSGYGSNSDVIGDNITIRLEQSNDPNLFGYIQITYDYGRKYREGK